MLSKLYITVCFANTYRYLNVQVRRPCNSHFCRYFSDEFQRPPHINDRAYQALRNDVSAQRVEAVQLRFIQERLRENKLSPECLHTSQPNLETYLLNTSSFPLDQLSETSRNLLHSEQLSKCNHLEQGAQQVAIDCVDSAEARNTNADEISRLLWRIYPLHRYAEAAVKQDLTARINKLALSNLTSMDFIGVCRLLHWNISWPLAQSSAEHMDPTSLLNRLIRQCRTSNNLTLINYLVYLMKFIHEDITRPYANLCSEIHAKAVLGKKIEFDKLAVTCLTMFSCNKNGVIIYRRDSLCRVWETVANYASKMEGKDMPMNISFCIKQAVASTAALPLLMAKYPYMPQKIFGSIDKMLGKIMRANREYYTLSRILYAMVGSRHINIDTVRTIANHALATDWSRERFKEVIYLSTTTCYVVLIMTILHQPRTC